jgi:adenylate kinase
VPPQQLNLLLFGPQGSGKGTQAKRIAAEHGIPHVSTGDMFRAAIAKQTPLGKQVEPILDAGDLVPDDLTVGLIRERLAEPDAADGFILDGFPRNLAQAEALDELLAELGRPLTLVLELLVSDRVAAKRLAIRAGEEGRADDRSATIIRRLEIYHRDTKPLSDYYRSSGKLVGVPGEGSVDEVWSEVEQALEQAVPA